MFGNLTAIEPSGHGFLTIYPCDQGRPNASHVNYAAGGIVPNAVITKLSADGKACIYSLATTHVALDINGFTTGPKSTKPPTTLPTITETVDDIPGVALQINQSATGILDNQTKPHSVYAVNLTAGVEYVFQVEAPDGLDTYYLYYPETVSVETATSEDRVFYGYQGSDERFTPATSGTYYLDIRANKPGQAYSAVVRAGATHGASNTPTDIPGSPLAMRTLAKGVVDSHTRKQDVYAVNLTAGVEYVFQVVAPNDLGTYYLSIRATGPGQTYSAVVRTN